MYRTSAGSASPMGWSADGRSIYVVEGKTVDLPGPAAPLGETVTDAKILMVPVNGGRVKTVASLPFEEIGSVSHDPRRPQVRRLRCTRRGPTCGSSTTSMSRPNHDSRDSESCPYYCAAFAWMVSRCWTMASMRLRAASGVSPPCVL